MRIVVTGGSGDLGGRVVREIEARGHEAVAASRRTGVDLTTGEGLDSVLQGVDAVIHSASSQIKPQDVDVAGARRIGESLRRIGSSAHVVSISIVGSDRIPYAYYRAKVDSERVLEEAEAPATVLRATQFHSLAAFFGTAGRVGPLTFSIGAMRIQPVDIDWVAQRLTDYATGPAPSGYRRATDIAGPTAYSADRMAEILATHDGRKPPRVVRIPPVLPVMRGFAGAASSPDRKPRSADSPSRTGSASSRRPCLADSTPPRERRRPRPRSRDGANTLLRGRDPRRLPRRTLRRRARRGQRRSASSPESLRAG